MPIKKFLYFGLNEKRQWGGDTGNVTQMNPWQQFTGLKDKNGKEIYEGDILIDDDSEPCRHKIVWDELDMKFELLTWVGGKEWDRNIADFGREYFEVIGNIYENPELLK